MKIKLIKLKSNHNNLRTDEVEGNLEALPEVGEPLVMSAPGLHFGTRIIITSLIQEIVEDTGSKITFRTMNSTYELELL